ncbi:uncharacterized protein F4812DRAFT_259349 [Daldinia caldariorum]|uniref:uncharacterized protein n=1 Tax=Daldinia caldariorum TaxID=326644 RepID=UPI0020077A39|nr:uncharacterized protein F4812DRAFT_259349 [Daldinia caldariorum]KAI1470276.1 hypothetical protein F4812DRAFT_259349 [Daldinia caldariorum]
MTMNAGYTVSPASLDLRDHLNDRTQQPRRDAQPSYNYNYNQKCPVTPIESHLLSPFSSHVRSNSASPTTNINTPADTVSTTDFYQPSEFSSDFDDPFLGVDFDIQGALPQFLGGFDSIQEPITHVPAQNAGLGDALYPLSPHQTPAVPPTATFGNVVEACADLASSTESQHFANQVQPFTHSVNSNQSAPQLTPDTNGGSFSSDESITPATLAMATQSPRVTVSMWNRDEEAPIQGVERSFTSSAESPRTTPGLQNLAGDLAGENTSEGISAVPRDAHGNWLPQSAGGYRGLAPGNRPSEEVPSPNQQATRRERAEKNKEVFEWVSRSAGDPSNVSGGAEGFPGRVAGRQDSEDDNIPSAEIPLGDATENKYIPGRTYVNVDGPGGPITQVDIEIMRQLPAWSDAPAIHAIQSGSQYQPATSQAAIERFNRQCQDNDSIVSRAATWGTRRRSLPSIVDMEEVLSGNIFKKLSISSHSRRPSFMKRIPSLVRKPSTSQLRKRKGSNASEASPEDVGESERRESKDTLAPPPRTSSWGINKKQPPSINTALIGMAAGAASIGTTHVRNGSISATVASPKSSFGALSIPSVKNTLLRPRSRTELPKSVNTEFFSHPNLVGMLKKQGGPPVAALAGTRSVIEQDDDEDEDEDEEGFDDSDIKTEPNKSKLIEPTFAGFREHVLDLNPGLPSENGWLADRIAYQMVIRYKQLQNAKIKHLNQVRQQKCLSGTQCIDLGGSAVPLDGKGNERSFDPLSARADSSDGDTTPLEGGISPESFPQGIPMPPTSSLPAEFECQLCFTSKKFQKPSDWTKHVHEDVQPFTCTWEKCQNPKMFKRKADWVRHENEGHRHLEWWTCDVDDCRHVCYRRDNFLQHLVREHKFAEPKIKTKAAIKKAGGGDGTWWRVESCHVDTSVKPSNEPCRFCRKTFPTWKKLTVHLAKHMEHISLPVLEVVARKELDADTIISPIQDPPRPSFPLPPVKQEPPSFSPGNANTPISVPMSTGPVAYPQDDFNYSMARMPVQNPVQNDYYSPHPISRSYNEMTPNQGPSLMIPNYNNNPHSPQPPYQSVPVTTMPSFDQPANTYVNLQPQQDGLEQFPAFDMNALGIQEPTESLCYGNLAAGNIQPVEQYSNHGGSVSPYQRSPHPGQNDFYSS